MTIAREIKACLMCVLILSDWGVEKAKKENNIQPL